MRRKETVMPNTKDIILVVDYHAKNIEIRRLNCATGEERRLSIPTTKAGIVRLVARASLNHRLTADRARPDAGVNCADATGAGVAEKVLECETNPIRSIRSSAPPQALGRRRRRW
jgi:hypothetical protein